MACMQDDSEVPADRGKVRCKPQSNVITPHVCPGTYIRYTSPNSTGVVYPIALRGFIFQRLRAQILHSMRFLGDFEARTPTMLVTNNITLQSLGS